ncbi:MAG TPA: anti-sigma-F factor Fin family protein [Clostridia bacterium]|jgi:hypothetical protein|nr:anti-sigma-F factor Fin family protein [Clostridia bacterium]
MRIRYICEYCHDVIGEFVTDEVDESKLGISNLTDEEKAAIITIDKDNSRMDILSLCDDCVGAIDEETNFNYDFTRRFWLH